MRVVYTLYQKRAIVYVGIKKITEKFSKEKFTKSLKAFKNNYYFTRIVYDQFDDDSAALHFYNHKIKSYKKTHKGMLPVFNAMKNNEKEEKKQSKARKVKNKSKKLKAKVAKKTIAKQKVQCLISAKNLKLRTVEAYKLGYKDAKAGRKKDLTQTSLDVWSKK